MLQLDPWPREAVSAAELAVVVGEIRNLYWFIRNSRRGVHDARRRRIYRKIEAQKNACWLQASRNGRCWIFLLAAGRNSLAGKAVLAALSTARN